MADKKKAVLNALISGIADRHLRGMAEKLAATVPADSWFRSEVGETILAALKGLAEGLAEGQGTLGSLAIEKATDFLDFAATPLFGKGAKGKSTAAMTAQAWMGDFMKYAQQRLSEAKTDVAVQFEIERLEKEFVARQRIMKMVEDAAKAASPAVPESTPIDWNGQFQKMKETARRIWQTIDSGAAKATPHVRNLRLFLETKGVRP